jgi:hypothetical protein
LSKTLSFKKYMNNIETYADLMVEKDRLEKLLFIQKEAIIMDITELKKEFKPTMDLLLFISRLSTKNNNNPLVSTGVNFIGDFLLKHILLAKSGWVVRLVIPFLIKNYASHELAKEGTGLLSKLATILTKKSLPK